MAGFDVWQIYGRDDDLTPGTAQTLTRIERDFALAPGAVVLDVACGRGTGARRLAGRGWRVVGIDTHAFLARVAAAIRQPSAPGAIAFVAGDGGALPVRDGACDGAVCLGGPSIIGTERCLRAMHAALRPGGWLAVSDWMWHEGRVPAAAIPTWYEGARPSVGGYAALVRDLGCEVVYAWPLPRRAWDDYYAPLRPRVAALRAAHPEAPRQPIEDELQLWDSGLGPAWWRYGVVIARKR